MDYNFYHYKVLFFFSFNAFGLHLTYEILRFGHFSSLFLNLHLLFMPSPILLIFILSHSLHSICLLCTVTFMCCFVIQSESLLILKCVPYFTFFGFDFCFIIFQFYVYFWLFEKFAVFLFGQCIITWFSISVTTIY